MNKQDFKRLMLCKEFDELSNQVDVYDILVARREGEERDIVKGKRDALVLRMKEIDEALINRTY